MRVRSPLYMLRHLLILAFFFNCVASANLQSATSIEAREATDKAAVGLRPRDRRAARDARAGATPHLSLSTEEPGTVPARSLQEATNGTNGECKGSKFQIVIHFDAHPEDFAMRLKNDDTNRSIWTFADHKYPSSQFQHKTVAAGVCLPKERCWVLTVSDSFGDGMGSNDLTTPDTGGGFRLLFNGLTANYYTGKYNGCYKTMWFRFGEWCSAQEQFWYAPSDDPDCNFTAGRAPDDGWFDGDLYRVGPAPPSPPQSAPAPASATPVPAPSPVRVVLPATSAPIAAPGPSARVGPTDRPVLSAAPVRTVAPTDRPSDAYVATPVPGEPTASDADPLALAPTREPHSSSLPSAISIADITTSPPSYIPSAAVTTPPASAVPSIAASAPSPPAAPSSSQPVVCLFFFCR